MSHSKLTLAVPVALALGCLPLVGMASGVGSATQSSTWTTQVNFNQYAGVQLASNHHKGKYKKRYYKKGRVYRGKRHYRHGRGYWRGGIWIGPGWGGGYHAPYYRSGCTRRCFYDYWGDYRCHVRCY